MILEKIHEEGMIPGERGIMSKKRDLLPLSLPLCQGTSLLRLLGR